MNDARSTRVCVFYPADPLGAIPGGIDSFIRGLISYAPADIRFSVVGVTTDVARRPIGKWVQCAINSKGFDFLAVKELKNPGRQSVVPMSLKYFLALRKKIGTIDADILEYHGIESSLAFLRDHRPKTLVVHQNMQVLYDPQTDIRWKYFPRFYFLLEKFLIRRIQAMYCVRADAVSDYKKRYPDIADRFRFTPTWVDTRLFCDPSDDERASAKQNIMSEFGFGSTDPVLITVGRLDSQKNPLLLVRAFRQVLEKKKNARLIFVGDGILRNQIESFISEHALDNHVKLCGVKNSRQVAELLRGADVFVLSSAYEGMPICVLESLGTGLPVVSTDVGEVSRVVQPGKNGELVEEQSTESLSVAILHCLNSSDVYRGLPCTRAISEYVPSKVLKPIYQRYRELAKADL